MASGSFCNNVGQNCNLIISWNSVKGQGGSTVNATLIAQNRNGWYFDAVVYDYGITINGSQVTGTGARLSASSNGSSGLISHSVWVPYTGDKSITISGYANFNGIINLSNQSISGTVALDKIGSAPTMGSVTAPTTSTISEKTTSITVKWNKASSYNNSVTYAIGCSINGGSYEWRYPDNNINTTSYTWDIGTPTQGATYQFAVCCANDIARSDYKYSGVVTINKLSPPTIGDIGTYNPYTNSTLTIPLSDGSTTNGENFVRMCDLYYGDTWLCNAKSYTDTPWKNTSQAISYAAANYVSKLGTKAYSSNKFKITAWIENANRSRSSYVSKIFTVNINSDGGATPTLSLPTLSGGAFNNAATCFIAGISTLNVSSPAASLRRAPSGTTISYKIACTGATTQNSQNANFSGLTAGTKTITVTATDSRGLSVSVSKQIVVQSYAAPTIRAFTAIRLDDPNTSAKLVYTLAYSPIYQYTDVDTKGNQLNGISLQQYKKNNFDWATASDGLVLTNLETDSTYTIQLRVADKVKTTTYITATQVIPTIKTTMAWRSWGVGIGCIPQSEYALEVNGSSKISGSLDASNMLQVNSNGVAIGKTSEKSAFEVNMDSYLYKNLGVTGDIYQSASSCSNSIIGSLPIAGTIDTMTLGDIRKYKSGLYTSIVDSDWSYLWVNKHRNGADNGNSYNNYILQSFWDDNMYHGRVDGAGGIESKHLFLDTGNFLNRLYPVGAIYLTWNNNNPGNFLGGTWVRMAEGRGLFGVGRSTGRNGIAANVNEHEEFGDWKHTISVDEMPPHKHAIGQSNFGAGRNDWGLVGAGAHGGNIAMVNYSNGGTSVTGGGQSFYIMPPYIGIYVWRRTA